MTARRMKEQIATTLRADRQQCHHWQRRGLLRTLGPGLITCAVADDPSDIATYSQTGALFGYSLGLADDHQLSDDGYRIGYQCGHRCGDRGRSSRRIQARCAQAASHALGRPALASGDATCRDEDERLMNRCASQRDNFLLYRCTWSGASGDTMSAHKGSGG